MPNEPATIKGAKIQRNGAIIAAIIAAVVALLVAAIVYFGNGGGNTQKNSPNANQANGTGISQASQTGTSNNQTINNNYFSTPTNAAQNQQHDNLLLTIQSPFGADVGPKYHADVLFINNGDRDATIADIFVLIDLHERNDVTEFGLWGLDPSNSIIVPPRKTVSQRFDIPDGTLANLKHLCTNDEYRTAELYCRVIDGDGNLHKVKQPIGKFRVAGGGYSFIGPDSGSLRLLPSPIYGGDARTGLSSEAPQATR